MKKILSIICLTLALSLTACGKESEEIKEPEKEVVTVVDHANREVEFEEVPERIVTTYYISTSIALSLGLEDKLVGIESMPEVRPLYSYINEDILKLPQVGTMKNFNLESCLSLEPDLVILAYKQKDYVKSFDELGIKCIVINPETETLLNESIEMIAKATGTTEKSELVNNKILEYREFLAELTSQNDEEIRAYFAGNSSYLSTAPGKMYQQDLLELAGLTNVAGDIDDTYWVEISYEQLLSYNPDVIVIASNNDYSKEDLMNDEMLKDLTAIKEGKVYEIPDSIEAWDSPLPSSILGSLYIASEIYESYTSEDFLNDVNSFYSEIYGFTVEGI